MKLNLLVFVLAIASFRAFVDAIPPSANGGKMTKEEAMKWAQQKYTKFFDEGFANFTDIFRHGGHPSVSGPMINITICIEDKGIKESLKSFLIDFASLNKLRVGMEERRQACMNHSAIFTPIMDCITQSNEPEHDEFVGFLYRNFINFLDEFCQMPDAFQLEFLYGRLHDFLHKFPEYEKITSKAQNPDLPLKEEDECLPIRAAEIFEIAVIQSHRIPFGFHASYAERFQLITLFGKPYPYKTFEECA